MTTWFSYLLLGVAMMMVGCAHDPLKDIRFKQVPLTSKHWEVAYNGGGKVFLDKEDSGDLSFSPQVATTPDTTFAALLLLKDTMRSPIRDYAVRIDLTTTKQLRPEKPNDWETFWFFGNYRKDKGQSKYANYVIMKPQSGIELGRAFDEVGQQFLKTSAKASAKIGERYVLIVLKRGGRLQVFKNGNEVMSYESGQMPHALYDLPGTIGLYSEDAEVQIHSFAYQAL